MEEGQGSNNEAREPVEAELETFDLQMRWLQIGNGVCKHGIVFPFDAAAECEEFVETFTAKFSTAQGPIADCFQAAIFVTRKNYAEVWKDLAKMEWIVSAFVASATRFLSYNIIAAAGARTSFASFFEQWIALKLHGTQFTIDWVQIHNLFFADEQTLRSYLRERCNTYCTCLHIM